MNKPPHSIEPRRPTGAEAGFSLLELLFITAIISILVTMTISFHGIFKQKAGDAACTSHLRTLHVCLGAYLIDNYQWPQQPMELHKNPEKMWEWWITETEPYGAEQKYWMCPTHKEFFLAGRKPEDIPDYWSSYIPTHFDDHDFTPNRWSQPWFMERGNYHGKGAKLIMPDGSIRYIPGMGF